MFGADVLTTILGIFGLLIAFTFVAFIAYRIGHSYDTKAENAALEEEQKRLAAQRPVPITPMDIELGITDQASKKEAEVAAVKLQSAARGMSARKEVEEMKVKESAKESAKESEAAAEEPRRRFRPIVGAVRLLGRLTKIGGGDNAESTA